MHLVSVSLGFSACPPSFLSSLPPFPSLYFPLFSILGGYTEPVPHNTVKGSCRNTVSQHSGNSSKLQRGATLSATEKPSLLRMRNSLSHIHVEGDWKYEKSCQGASRMCYHLTEGKAQGALRSRLSNGAEGKTVHGS